MKRILSMGLALLMLLGAVCIPVSASMPDNPHPYDHEGYIRPGDKFRPYDALTRAEMVCLLYRMLDDEQKRDSFVGYDCKFTDVDIPQNTWYGRALMNLDLLGIVKGYEDGTFRPNQPVSRAEFVVLLSRIHELEAGEKSFPDVPKTHWAYDAIAAAGAAGWINGYEDGTFKPDRNITRAEAVTLVNRTLDRHPDKNHFTKDMLVWPDNMDQTKWYYADMQEATNSHTYQMKENSDKTKYENWTKTLPIRNWEALEKAWSNANSSQGNGNVV